MWRGADGTTVRQAARVGALVFGCFALANCSSSNLSSTVDPRYGVSSSPRVVEYGQPVPKGGGTYRIGKPYMVAGRAYVPEENIHYSSEGIASWYGSDFHGRLTANGEIYDMDAISAAHPTLPMPCYVRVTNLANRRSMIVRVNDRGPYAANREIDLSGKAAQLLGFRDNGLARVRVEYVAPAPLEGSDDRQLVATLREGVPAPPPTGVMVASAKPFVPEIGSRSPLLRGSIPMPSERPYDLGETPAEAVGAPLRGSPEANVAPRAKPAVASGSPPRPHPVLAEGASQPAVSPIAAYAPIRAEGPVAVTTGRGLY